MARVEVYQGGNIQNQGTTGARVRSADFGENPLAAGLQKLGEVGSKAVDTMDQIADVNARVEANRLAVEHSEHVRQLSQKVRESLGEGADATAEQAVQELQAATKELVGRASPRARMLLQGELTTRTGAATDSWLTHGFEQKKDAFETSSQARIARISEDAADIDDEDAAKAMLSEVQGINEKRAQFFGKGKDWLMEQDRKVVSGFYKSRALKLASGQSGSASAAIAYAEKNREFLDDNDYNAIVNAYDDAAMDETAMAIVYGGNPVGAAVEAPKQQDDGGPPARLDPLTFFKTFTIPAEGRSYVVDSNGAGVKYGINAAYNPGVNIQALTEDRAASIFTEKYFKRSGADKLPPALAAVHVDTFFLNERQANKILKESGGDVDKYIELRGAFLNGLAAKNPAKYGRYQAGWANRTKALADYADRLGGDGTPIAAPVTATTSLEGIRKAVMARTDISAKLKRKVISQLEGRRSELIQERNIAEAETDRQLTTAALALGDNFTDIKQLPANLLTGASPNTIAQFTNMAKSNRENKPLTPAAAAQIGFLQTFKPQSFADPAVQKQLAVMGVPTRTITQLAQSAGQAQGKVAEIDRSKLEAVARPAFESAGIRLWTTENSKDKKKADWERETREDPAMQANLLNYLDLAAKTWAAANPGKEPDQATMQRWVGSALVTVQNGQAFGTVSNRDLVNLISPHDRRSIVDGLNARGVPPTESNVANAYRQLRILRGR